MCLWSGLYRWLGLALVVSLLTAVSACDEDEVFVPADYPNVRGFWSGQYRVSSCSLSGATDPFFCDEVFWNGASLILELDLDQSGPQVGGAIYQGELVGDVEGNVDLDGVVTLEGVIGGFGEDFTTTILAWQAGLVGDSLMGSWRFWVEDNTGQGFGAATVDASFALYGPSVVKFFGCAAEDELVLGGQMSAELAGSDCQLASGIYVPELEDGASFDLYTLTGGAGDSIEVTLRSEEFDAVMLVADLYEEFLGWDDDSGGGTGGTDAAVTIVFDAAETILLIATSYLPGEAGAYTLGGEVLLPSAPVALTGPAGRELGRGLRVIGGGVRKHDRPDDRYPESLGRKFRRSSSRASGPPE